MRVAIVGATGMLGKHTLAAAAAAGHDVVAIARSISSLQRLRNAPLESRLADLDDRESLRRALKNVDAVVNCAGYYPTAPRPSRGEGGAEAGTECVAGIPPRPGAPHPPAQKIFYRGGPLCAAPTSGG